MSKFKLLSIVLILINLILGAWFVLHNDIIYGYSGDIARDMYLLQQTVQKKIILIGAHSGGIPGLFHGPAWIYLNLPAFIITDGNPVGVGWFWVILSIIALGINYFVASKFFNKTTALVSCILYSVFLIEPMKALINPFGAVLFFPIFFYCIYIYSKKSQLIYLLAALFAVGLMIQFQVAFGGPILVLLLGYLVYQFKKTHKWLHSFAVLILCIPLSTYFLFEIRHGFLQLKSLYNYISGAENFAKQPFFTIIASRLYGFFVDGLYIFKLPRIVSLAILAVFSYFVYKNKSKVKHSDIYKLFLYFYGGYWLIMFLYKGIVFDYYYWPFLPVVTILFASTYTIVNKKIFISIFAVMYIFTFVLGYQSTVYFAKSYIGKDVASWLFNKNLAEAVFENNDNEFGYFIFTPDLHATGTKYAMYYVQKHKNNKGYLNTKKKVTYIIFAPPLEGLEYNNGDWWKTNQVNIKRKADSVTKFPNGFRIEKYILSDSEVQVQTDQGLVNEFNLAN